MAQDSGGSAAGTPSRLSLSNFGSLAADPDSSPFAAQLELSGGGTSPDPSPSSRAHMLRFNSIVRRADSILQHVDDALKCAICADIFNEPVR